MEQNKSLEKPSYKYFFLGEKADAYGRVPQAYVMHKIEDEVSDHSRLAGYKLACGTAHLGVGGYSLKDQLHRDGFPTTNPYKFTNTKRCPICFPNEQ